MIEVLKVGMRKDITITIHYQLLSKVYKIKNCKEKIIHKINIKIGTKLTLHLPTLRICSPTPPYPSP